jgi:hypothetical protein
MDREDIKLVVAVMAGLIVGCVAATIFIVFATIVAEWIVGG